jgi:hypothetical protein
MADDTRRNDPYPALPTEMPDLSNVTLEYLVDNIGYLREINNRNDKLQKYYEAALKGALKKTKGADGKPMSAYAGEHFFFNTIPVTQERFSREEAEKILTPEQINACIKPLSFVQLKFNRRVTNG